jgi:hypothetical protein
VARSFRFRPRYRGVAWTALGVGGTLGTIAIASLGAAILPLATGAFGVVLGAAYLMSPTWKLEVVIDDAGLEVRTPSRSRFKLAWSEVVRVVASPSTHTCFVDGGESAKSLLVPGVGAPAPYAIEDRDALYDEIVKRVDAAKIQEVESIESARVHP